MKTIMTWIGGAGFVFLLVGFLYMAHLEGGKWEAYKKAHSCKMVSYVSGSIFNTYGVTASGQMTIGVGSTPPKQGWACDDGITYYTD